MAKVYAPNEQYSGLSASVMFVDGVGETSDPHLLAWFKGKGYRVEEEVQAEQKPIDDMTVAELKAYAEANGIDLGEATKKADILAVIQSAKE